MLIIADRCCARKRGGASACADIEQSRVRNAIVPVSRYHYAASLLKISGILVNAARKSNHRLHTLRDRVLSPTARVDNVIGKALAAEPIQRPPGAILADIVQRRDDTFIGR